MTPILLSLPSLFIVRPIYLLGIFCIVALCYLTVGAILRYHWVNYGTDSREIHRMTRLYVGIGCFLLCLQFLFIYLYTVGG